MEIRTLSLTEIEPSDQNTRAELNGAPMAELMNSIEQVGLLNPILVRKKGDGYEVIAGHRRFEAHKRLQRPTIAVRVIEASDEDAAQIRLIENLQRQDLNAIEEAEAFAQLRDHHAMTPAMIAQRADKTLPYVTRALALLFLPKAVVKAIREGTLTPEHGHQIARAPKDKFDKLAAFALTVNSWSKRGPTGDELKHEIEKHIEKPLGIVPFPLDVPQYGGTELGTCDACPFNTGNQGALFDGAKAGSCVNGSCYQKRWNFGFKELAEKQSARWPKVAYLGVKVGGYNHSFGGYAIVSESDKRIKKEMAEHPERFAFGFEKPSAYGMKKTRPVLVRTQLDPSAPQPKEAPARDWEREQFVTKAADHALLEAANKWTDVIGKKELTAMLDEGDGLDKSVAKLTRDGLIKLLWLRWLNGYDIMGRLAASGFNKKEIMKVFTEATNKAGAAYDEQQKKAHEEKK